LPDQLLQRGLIEILQPLKAHAALAAIGLGEHAFVSTCARNVEGNRGLVAGHTDAEPVVFAAVGVLIAIRAICEHAAVNERLESGGLADERVERSHLGAAGLLELREVLFGRGDFELAFHGLSGYHTLTLTSAGCVLAVSGHRGRPVPSGWLRNSAHYRRK